MSDLLGDVDVEFPKTVGRCHAEIERLRDLIREADRCAGRYRNLTCRATRWPRAGYSAKRQT